MPGQQSHDPAYERGLPMYAYYRWMPEMTQNKTAYQQRTEDKANNIHRSSVYFYYLKKMQQIKDNGYKGNGP